MAKRTARNSSLPEAIKIGGTLYEVLDDTLPLLREGLAGKCLRDKCEIRINTEHDHQAVQDTLLHEVLHSLSYAYDLELTESQVVRLTSGLTALMLDNPDFIEYLQS